MKESYVFLANGFEEIEAITVIDLLRRAEIPVKTVSIGETYEVEGAHGVSVKADILISEMSDTASKWLILPGGMPGAENLYNCQQLRTLLEKQVASEDGKIAAICASPAVVLGRMGLLKNENATCYPGFESMLEGAVKVDLPVVVSSRFVLGNGPSAAMRWALAIIEVEKGDEEALKIADHLLLYTRSETDVNYSFS